MTDLSHTPDRLLPPLDGGAGPALPIDDSAMRSMVAAAIGGGVGPGGGGSSGGHATSSGAGSVAVKAGIAGVAVGAAVVAAVVISGVGERMPMAASPVAARVSVQITPDVRAGSSPPPPPSRPVSAQTKPAATARDDARPSHQRKQTRAAPVPRPAMHKRTPDDLLRRANEARKRHAWRAADALYQKVWRRHGGSRAGYVALVASAQLDLGPLAKPALALRLFGRALRTEPGGFLTEEARFGVARALRKLGNTTAEKRALTSFLRHHPGSALAARVRARLEALAKDRAP